MISNFYSRITLSLLAVSLSPLASAADVTLDTGTTAWMMTAAMFVLLMCIPGLALFYGGLVRAKNFLSVFTQLFAVAGVIGVPPCKKKRLVGQEVPFGRMGTADDLTGMAIFLASSESEYVVAQTYNVDGGNWMS